FLQITFLPSSIQTCEQLVKKQLISRHIRKLTAASQHQNLIDCLLEAVMPLFDIAVLIRVTSLRFLPTKLVVSQQPLVGSCKLLLVTQVVHSRAHPVRSMLEGNTT